MKQPASWSVVSSVVSHNIVAAASSGRRGQRIIGSPTRQPARTMMPVINASMPMDKVIALGDEVDAAASLLRHGLSLLASYTFASRDVDAVFVCLAGGAEKLLKLSTGLHALDTSGELAVEGHDDGHRPRHRQAARPRATSHRPGCAHRQHRSRLHRRATRQGDNDPHIGKVLETLGSYAIKGRFYNLDHLADAPQPDDSPKQLWEALHQGLLRLHPNLLMQLASVAQSQAARAELIISSITGWRELITRAWRTGVFGSLAKQWAPQLST